MDKNLQESLSYFSDKVSDAVKARKKILVTTHIDCDGITSGSIISVSYTHLTLPTKA